MAQDWDIAVGDHLTRDERMRRFGGARYGGIEPSAKTPNVFIYSDPERSADIYPYDGWAEDDKTFLYTGEGRLGDQRMQEGNRAVLEHRERGRALRVFVADGTVPDSAEKNHLYIGQFEVDPDEPYVQEPAPDDNDELRTVYVFRLRPVDEPLRRPQDTSGTGDAPTEPEAQLVDPEQQRNTEYEVAGSEPQTARRREAELVTRYENYLTGLGHDVQRWRIRPPGELLTLVTDTYDGTEHTLYEAKGTTTRDAIRRAIGQLLDYRRHIAVDDLRLAVLLPDRPSNDLLDLLSSLDIACVYESSEGAFDRLEPSRVI